MADVGAVMIHTEPRDRGTEEALARTREALRESEERLRAIFQQAAVGIAVVSLEGFFLEMNRKFLDILGYTAEQLQQRTFADITHPEDLEVTWASVHQLIEGAIADYSIEKRFLRQDGDVVWALTSVTLIKDAEGQPQHLLGVIEDITARKQTEHALREETRILELLNHAGRTLGSTLETDGLIQAVTDAATGLSGATSGAFFYNHPDQVEGSFRLRAVSGQQPDGLESFAASRVTAMFGPVFRGDAPVRSDDLLTDPRDQVAGPRHETRSSAPPVRSCLAAPVRSRSGQVIGALFFAHPAPGVFSERAERLVAGVAAQAGMALDNARLYEAAQQAAHERETLLESERAARAAAERLSEMKDEFLATLSHELRTPLNAILGWSHVLRSSELNDPDVRKGLETIERNARAQTQLIGDLLDMSRIASGKVRLEIQTIPPASFIEAAIEAVTPAADAKAIRIEKRLDRSAGPITGDPDRLQQVIWNLLSNAIKFTPRHGTVQVSLARVDAHIEMRVTDTGIGIKPDLVPHLFERFRQGDASTTREYGGLGLGLSIVRSLVELHGGAVAAESPGQGQGTTLTVQLPLTVMPRGATASGTPQVRTPPQATSRFATIDLNGVTVLVVDDQPDALGLIRRVLEACEARVRTSTNAHEALRLVEAEHPDVMISDIGMPGTDGFELLRLVRALGEDRGGQVPAIALTAFARSEDRDRALRAGFQVHVAKPVDPSELVATVASVAGRVSGA